MAEATYSGAWKRAAYAPVDQGAVHTVDPAHGVVDLTAPNYQGVAPAVLHEPGGDQLADDADLGLYPGLDWVTGMSGAPAYDGTDYTSHDADPVDQGASRERHRASPVFQFAGDTYTGTYATVPDVNRTVPAVQLQRGRTGDPVNDPRPRTPAPEYFPEIKRHRVIGLRRHDRRVVWVNSADTAGRQGPVPGPYGSPLTTWDRVLTRMPRPAQRRAPEPLSESVTLDEGSTTGASPVVDYWTGG